MPHGNEVEKMIKRVNPFGDLDEFVPGSKSEPAKAIQKQAID